MLCFYVLVAHRCLASFTTEDENVFNTLLLNLLVSPVLFKLCKWKEHLSPSQLPQLELQ